MSKMNGVVLLKQGDTKNPGEMQFRDDLDIPAPTGKMVRIKTGYTGVCGSDVSYVYGKASVDEGRVLGHETGGVVDAVGPDVTMVKEGQRVVVDPVQSDPESPWVKRGMGNVDLSNVTGISYDGGFAEYYLSHEAYTYSIPDDMSLAQAAGLEPFACGLYAINNANITPNEMVVIFGAGPIANSMCDMAKAKGASTVVIIGTRDYRLDAARGADVRLNTAGGDSKYACSNLDEAIRDLNHGELPRSVIVATGAVLRDRAGLRARRARLHRRSLRAHGRRRRVHAQVPAGPLQRHDAALFVARSEHVARGHGARQERPCPRGGHAHSQVRTGWALRRHRDPGGTPGQLHQISDRGRWRAEVARAPRSA